MERAEHSMLRGSALFAFFVLGCIATGAEAPARTSTPLPDRITAGSAEWADLVRQYAEKPDGVADFEERRHFPFRKEPIVLQGQVRVSRRHGLSLHYTSPEV